MLPRRPEIPLFALVFGAYAFFYQAGGWNQNSRFDLTRAIVEQGTVAIDAFHENTGDKAQRGDHWFTDKAPGLSWLAVPAYALVHRVRPQAVVAGSYLGTVLAVALPSALAAAQLFGLGRLIGVSAAWSAGHHLRLRPGHPRLPVLDDLLRAPALGGAGALRLRAGLEGAVAGDGRSAARARRLRRLHLGDPGRGRDRLRAGAARREARRAGPRGRLAAGGALGLYHAAAFGHPFALPYDFVLQEHRRQGWFMGIGAPDARVAWAILFGSYRGLFYGAPWLIAGVPGLVVLFRRGFRAEALAGGTIVLAYVLLNAGLVDWHGGWAMGPRYLIPAIPFLAVGAMGLVRAWPEGSPVRGECWPGRRGRPSPSRRP